VHVVHQRRGERQQVAREPLHLLRHLQPRHVLAHQRLVDVQVEQPHLGVGDLRERLAVHATELQEGNEGEPRVEHGRHVAQRLEILVRDPLQGGRRQSDAVPEALDQRLLEPGLARGVLQVALGLLVVAEQRLDVAVGQPPLAASLAEALERVAPRAQPRDDPRVRDRRRGPLAAPVDLGNHAAFGPAPERRRRDAHALGSFVESEGRLCHGPDCATAEWKGHSAAACGRAGPLRRPVAPRRLPVSTSRKA
jgi:hypothetical protein